MKEIRDIIQAYQNVKAMNACALATVVHVEGSSYRRPGARMLVTDNGMLTGAISGGCLEGDARRKALLAISEGKNKLVTYDTTDEDDAKFGVQLGCNGIVHILFEPIFPDRLNHPIELLQKTMAMRRPAVLSTIFSMNARAEQKGTCFFYADGEQLSAAGSGDVRIEDAQRVLSAQLSQIQDDGESGSSIFYQFVPPPFSLIIAGAGNDAQPLANLADMLGWEVTLADGRMTHANAQRFPNAKKIVVTKADEALLQTPIDGATACVLMSHNYNYDLGMLKQLLKTTISYIGILGPRTKMDRMYTDLEREGIVVADRIRIYSPVGLDIGAETSEEIALSIAAEIKAVFMQKAARMLREKETPVHA